VSVGEAALTTDHAHGAGSAGVGAVRAAAQGLGAVMDRLDPAVVTVNDAMVMVEVFGRIERMAAAGKTLMAKRATDSPRLLRHKGFKDGVDYLARTLDISAGDAAATLGWRTRWKASTPPPQRRRPAACHPARSPRWRRPPSRTRRPRTRC
jgi:hypothetical protein